MFKLSAIVAIDKNNGIGYQNKLLYSVPDDIKRFKEITRGHVIIMGRKTADSLPNKQALKNRINVVITKNFDLNDEYKERGFFVSNQIENNFYEYIDNLVNKFTIFKEAFIIGGASIYRFFLPFIDTIYLTRFHKSTKNCDTWFPLGEWKGQHLQYVVSKEIICCDTEKNTNELIKYDFERYDSCDFISKIDMGSL